jgi:hypothetical protein
MKGLQNNLPYFAGSCLIIKDKGGQLVPFKFNKAQRYIHAKLEEQKKRTGKVRALILKGRQQGASTYTSARYFHKTIFIPGTGTFILSHQAKTTGPLFDMVKRFHKNMDEAVAPEIDTSNKNQIKFAGMESEYTVGTAGNEDLGRGLTIKLLHCSEAAWYAKTDDLETGLFQAVANLEGTEIIHESTANGMNNMFYRKAIDALKGRGEFILIFTPWFWQEEYRTEPPEDFILTDEETDIARLYDLDNAQMYWRRNKIIDFGDEWKFKQEYPMNAMEAFIVSGSSFLSAKTLMEARKNIIHNPSQPKILGLDCARTNDRVVWVLRQGRKILWYKVIQGKDIPEDPSIFLGQETARIIDREGVNKCFIDYGQGYGVIDFLRTSGYRDIVQGVYFSKGAFDKVRFLNKRAEMAFALRDWFEEMCDIPDDDDFFSDLLVTPMYLESPTGKIYLVSKVKIKKDSGISTDIFDGTILTFAYPVSNSIKQSRIRRVNQNDTRRKSELTTIRRVSGTQKRVGSVSANVNY